MRAKLLLTGATSLLLSASTSVSAAELTVIIKNVRSAAGAVYVAVYDSSGTFLKVEQARAKMKIDAAKGEVVVTVHNLPANQYAVTAYHDENNNGKFDKNWLGLPTEGYGFSNDVRSATGPPKFTQAAFPIQADLDKSISFSLHY